MGRATQGVKLINLKNGDEIAAVTKVLESALNGVDLEEGEALQDDMPEDQV
jgi:DNA gyrase subunit A